MWLIDTQMAAGAVASLIALAIVARDAGAFRNMPQRIATRMRRAKR